MFGIGGFEILLIFLVILLLFGSDRLPEFARNLGKTWGTIKKTTNEVRREFEEQANIVEEESQNIKDEVSTNEKQ